MLTPEEMDIYVARNFDPTKYVAKEGTKPEGKTEGAVGKTLPKPVAPVDAAPQPNEKTTEEKLKEMYPTMY
jgi:hypothetical protein